MSLASYSQAENGVVPGRNVLDKLAKYYKVSVDYLLGKEEKTEGLSGKARTMHYKEDIRDMWSDQAKNSERLAHAMAGLSEIYDSNDSILIPTIEANIRAFQLSARREHQNQQQQDQIKKLESKCEELLKRLEDLEEKLASYDELKKGEAA